MTTDTIQIKRGNAASIPTLNPGELYWAKDTETLWIGTASGNVQAGGGGDSLTLTPAPGTDQDASGLKAAMTCGETVAFGNVCYLKSDGKLWLADASTDATVPGLWMALEAGAADAEVDFLCLGYVRDDAWAWTVGGVLYLSTTAGGMTQTAPTGNAEMVQVLGVATHADRIYFKPSPDLVRVLSV